VTVDTLRADHLEVYGHERPTAPFTAGMAASGIRFARAVSQSSWTLPAMASVHSSLYPIQHGAIQAEIPLPDAAETLAERLQQLGYGTVAVVGHEFVATSHGFAQGFDVFDESNVRGHEAVTSRDLTLTALARLDEVQEPFFLWVHYFDPHFTYVRHPEVGFADGYAGPLPDKLSSGLLGEQQDSLDAADVAYVEAVYDEEIVHTDEWMGRLWQSIGDRYGDGRSVLVLTADHGEYFLERGRFFHGRDVYRELVDVPLVIAGAIDEELRGTVVQAPVETRSIPRTVLGLLGLPGEPFDGDDLLEVARGADPGAVLSEGSHAFGTMWRSRGVEYDGYKLVHLLDNDRWELYDLKEDPWERRNVYREHGPDHEVVAFLREHVEALEDLPRFDGQAPVNLSPEALERLRSLGYIR
jgi:arylsulfatase